MILQLVVVLLLLSAWTFIAMLAASDLDQCREGQRVPTYTRVPVALLFPVPFLMLAFDILFAHEVHEDTLDIWRQWKRLVFRGIA